MVNLENEIGNKYTFDSFLVNLSVNGFYNAIIEDTRVSLVRFKSRLEKLSYALGKIFSSEPPVISNYNQKSDNKSKRSHLRPYRNYW